LRGAETNATGRRRVRTVLLPALLLFACEAEKEDVPWVNPPEPKSAEDRPVAKSPDRLPPGELLQGSEEAFGFVAPKGMKLVRTSRKAVRIEGDVSFDLLTDYVKERIAVRHAEMFGQRLVFPNARIKGNKTGIYDLILLRQFPGVVLLIRDRTRRPPTHGLSEAERWRKAGMKPSGGVIDPNSLE